MTAPLAAPFVVGAPRSGTTLLRLMLDAHPELAIPPETHFFPRLLEVMGSRTAFAEAVVSSPRWADLGLDETALRVGLARVEPFEAGAALRVVYRQYAQRFGKVRWGDKTPSHLRHMPAIAALLPEARFVHLVRDGRDVACSIVERPWGPRTVGEAAEWWRRQIVQARAAAPRLPGYLVVRYEDLVASPAAVLRAVCAAVELRYDAAMLDYHQTAGQRLAEIDRDLYGRDGGVLISASERLAMHRLATEPPRSDTSRWHERLTRREVAQFERVAGDVLAELGYPVGSEPRSST